MNHLLLWRVWGICLLQMVIMNVIVNVNINVYVYSTAIKFHSISFHSLRILSETLRAVVGIELQTIRSVYSRLYNLHLWYGNTLHLSVVSSLRNIFCVLSQSLQFSILRSTKYLSLLHRQKQHGIRSLSKASTHGPTVGIEP